MRRTVIFRKSSSRIFVRSPPRAWLACRRWHLADHLWTIAVARLVFPPSMNIQAPPNLNAGRVGAADRGRHQRLGRRVAGHAGSCEPRSAMAAPRGARACNQGGRQGTRGAPRDLSALRQRRRPNGWTRALQTSLLHTVDADGWPRTDEWSPGMAGALPRVRATGRHGVITADRIDSRRASARAWRSRNAISYGSFAPGVTSSRRCARLPTHVVERRAAMWSRSW